MTKPIDEETRSDLERAQANHRGHRVRSGVEAGEILGRPFDPSTLCPCGKPADLEEIEMAALFAKIGPYRPQCSECSERTRDEARKREEAERRRREHAVRESRLSAIPPEMMETDISHPAFNAGLWVRVENWTPGAGEWLGVIGSAGQCKTRCVALLAAKLIRDGLHVEWQPMADLQALTDRMYAGDDGERAAVLARFDRLRACGLLVLDDWGKNTWTPTVERKVFEIVDHRKTHHLPVIWTANTHPVEILKAGEMSKDRGAPIVGRLIEASGGYRNILRA